MDCPACGHDKNKVFSTNKWPSMDTRGHKCKKCGHKFNSVAMPVAFEALMECAALATREWRESRGTKKDFKKDDRG